MGLLLFSIQFQDFTYNLYTNNSKISISSLDSSQNSRFVWLRTYLVFLPRHLVAISNLTQSGDNLDSTFAPVSCPPPQASLPPSFSPQQMVLCLPRCSSQNLLVTLHLSLLLSHHANPRASLVHLSTKHSLNQSTTLGSTIIPCSRHSR